jgi:tetratricopeptide (TPR) repeat protein
VKTDPADPIGPIKLGHVHSFLGEPEEARAAYRRGIQLGTERDALELATFLATVSIHEGDPAAALAELTELLSRVDASGLPAAERRAVRAFVLENMAAVAVHPLPAPPDAARATAIVTDLAAALRTSPEGEAAASYWESRLAIATGDPGARARIERYGALADTPEDRERHEELLGLAAFREGATEQAIEHLGRVSPDVGLQARYYLARALHDVGRVDEARKQFREVADWGFNSVDYALLRRDAAARAAGDHQDGPDTRYTAPTP